MWSPPRATTIASSKEMMATSGDYLRLWHINSDNHAEMKGLLNNNKHTGRSALFCESKCITVCICRVLCPADVFRLERD